MKSIVRVCYWNDDESNEREAREEEVEAKTVEKNKNFRLNGKWDVESWRVRPSDYDGQSIVFEECELA